MELGQNQKLWIEALRSGKYKQTKTVLCLKTSHGDNAYCCLGVANEIFNLNAQIDETLYGTRYQEVLGLFDSDGVIKGDEDELECLSLLEMNDSDGKTFVEIADFIEKNPELVFTHSV